MPVGPVVSFPDSADLGTSPPNPNASIHASEPAAAEAAAGGIAPRVVVSAMPSTVSLAGAVSAEEAGWGGNRGVGEGSAMRARVGGGMTAKQRARSVALSVACRRCLSCDTLYDLVRWWWWGGWGWWWWCSSWS